MSIEFTAAFPDDAEGVGALVQLYRCPLGHVSDIIWTAPEMALACETNELKFFCGRCKSARFASDAEARSLLAAFGLAPALRIYSS